MPITSISVTKLFGRFDHTIHLNREERVTIIHGPNGFGKTTLLRLVDAVFRGDHEQVRMIPFDTLHLEFDDDTYVIVRCSRDFALPERRFIAPNNESNYVKLTCEMGENGKNLFSIRQIPSPYIRGVVSSPYDRQTVERLAEVTVSQRATWSELLEKLQRELKSGSYLGPQEHLIAFRFATAPVHLVTHQRLLKLEDSARSLISSKDQGSFQHAVHVYSKEMREWLLNIQELYAQKSQELERTFPMRVIEAYGNIPDLSEETLRKKNKVLEAKRLRLVEFGILRGDSAEIQQSNKSLDHAMRKLLWVYSDDVEVKLAMFDELVGKFELFRNLINERFKYKRLRIDATHGITFEAEDGNILPPTVLSSGEQHELIMLYECLFKIKKDTLVLIDEPELSLHVSWQVHFLRDLQSIIKLAKFDALVATHSPQIIHDRWDLTVELLPPDHAAEQAADDALTTRPEVPG